jgi:ankyrin repeat protein
MATMNDHLDVAIALLKKGSDINYRGVEGATALFEATEKGHPNLAAHIKGYKLS